MQRQVVEICRCAGNHLLDALARAQIVQNAAQLELVAPHTEDR
jgi:hypothetical protein